MYVHISLPVTVGLSLHMFHSSITLSPALPDIWYDSMIPESIPLVVCVIICHEACMYTHVGDVVHRGIAQLLLGQAALFMKHQQRGHLERDGVCY